MKAPFLPSALTNLSSFQEYSNYQDYHFGHTDPFLPEDYEQKILSHKKDEKSDSIFDAWLLSSALEQKSLDKAATKKSLAISAEKVSNHNVCYEGYERNDIPSHPAIEHRKHGFHEC